MKAFHELPDGYQEVMRLDLKTDRDAALKINVGGTVIMVAVVLAGNLIVPHSDFMAGGTSFGFDLLRVAVLILGYVLYMVFHELTHAAAMKAVGGGKVVFGLTGVYAFAGSHEDYFDKSSYRCIALAPLVVWGVVFAVAAFVVPREWFWVVWFLQAGNIGGSAGDIYVTARLWKSPDSILVRDTGVNMTVFDRSS